MSISQDERERAVFRSRRMAETDRQSDLATARDNGRVEGMQEGMRKGMQKGEIRKAISIARFMADAGEPDDKIMRYTGLSRDEIKKLRN